MNQREKFSSRLGFILISAGCAIGLGNVYRFPIITGAYGGAMFVLIYIAFLLLLGIPVMTAELSVGRASQRSIASSFDVLEKKGQKWHWMKFLGIGGNYILMMFYTTVSAWMTGFFFKYLTGGFAGLEGAEIDAVYTNMQSSPAVMLGLMAFVVVGGFLVCSLGLQNGVERISKFMMLGLLGLIVVLAVNSCLLPGAAEGIKFYLLPDFARAAEAGFGNIITAAMNQAFFTLSIGMAGMQIFGSYMTKDHSLGGEAVRICLLDTFVAVMSGMIIFPACFSFGVQPDAGPPLIFMTLPKVFAAMAGGRFWGTLFFLFMTFACFTTVIGVFENLLANCIDNFGWERKKAVLINFVIVFLGSIPCALGDSLLKGLTIIGNRGVLDSEDFIVSNLLLPGGALIFVLFCATKYGWGFDKYLEETNTGDGFKMPRWIKPYLQFVLPAMILVIIVQGLI